MRRHPGTLPKALFTTAKARSRRFDIVFGLTPIGRR
jgi:hypothetical protein